MALWLPLGLFVLWRYFVHQKNTGDLTPERQAVYSTAMTFVKDPEKLETLAQAFSDTGLPEQARALRNRSRLPTLPENVKLARAQALKAALSSTDPVAIKALAKVFESQGMGAAAGMLKDYAQGLDQMMNVPPVQLTPANPPAPHPEDQLPHPESQVPPTQAGEHMGAPVPLAATAAPVPPMPHEGAASPHGEGFGSGPSDGGGDFGLFPPDSLPV
jgi:hypothetical protein